nr:unnamed protein product [Digitaria exilis]
MGIPDPDLTDMNVAALLTYPLLCSHISKLGETYLEREKNRKKRPRREAERIPRPSDQANSIHPLVSQKHRRRLAGTHTSTTSRPDMHPRRPESRTQIVAPVPVVYVPTELRPAKGTRSALGNLERERERPAFGFGTLEAWTRGGLDGSMGPERTRRISSSASHEGTTGPNPTSARRIAPPPNPSRHFSTVANRRHSSSSRPDLTTLRLAPLLPLSLGPSIVRSGTAPPFDDEATYRRYFCLRLWIVGLEAALQHHASYGNTRYLHP